MLQETATEPDIFETGWEMYRRGVRSHVHGKTSPIRWKVGSFRRLDRSQWLQQWTQIKASDVDGLESWLQTCPDPRVMARIISDCECHEWDLWVAYEWVFNTVSRTPRLPSPVMLDAGVTPQEFRLLKATGLQRRYRAARGHRGTVSLIFALQGLWGSSHMTLRQARRWRMNGFFDPSEAAEWRSKGFSASEAALWRQAGFDVHDAVADALMIAASQLTVAVDDDGDEFPSVW